MSDDSEDLEPIDVSADRTVETPTHPTVEMPANPTAGSSWPPGWYSDPWTAGQYRYWTGQTWTGETNRWGPANLGGGADPWPSLSSPVTSGYGLPTPAAPEYTPVSGSPRRGPIVAAVVALVLLLAVSGAIGYAIDSRSHSNTAVLVPEPSPSTPPTSAPSAGTTTPPRGVPSTDPDRRVLGALVVRQTDVGSARTVLLIPGGNFTSQPTLDLCNGSYASERLRTARLQVAAFDAAGNASLSTEAVLYRNPAASAQAFAELREVRANCPRKPVKSPVSGQTEQTVFKPAPDGDWPRVPTVDRQAYSFVTKAGGKSFASAAVYLRRGRALLGLYFLKPNEAPPVVAGRSSIENIVAVFEARMAQLPAAVVNRR